MYLFFDIECASVNKTVAKICVFGYCLADENFNVIEKEDLLINPHGEFHLTDRRGEKGLVLPYSYETFKKQPDFPAYADKIYSLLQAKDTLVCGHATGNDVKYLNLETHRYSLPSFCFDFADTQYVYMCRKGDTKRQYKLETIASELGVEFTPHRAVDDAYAAMKIAEAMCRAENMNFRDLMKKYSVECGHIENYEISPVTCRRARKEKEESKRRKELREKALADFHRYADVSRRFRNKKGEWKNVKVCFSRKIEESGEMAIALLSSLFKVGANYAYHVAECNLYVSVNGEESGRKSEAENLGIRVMTIDECRAALNALFEKENEKASEKENDTARV